MKNFNIIAKIKNIFAAKKDYTALQVENFEEHGYDLKLLREGKTVWKGQLCNTRVCYDCHLATKAIAFSDRRQPNINTNFTMFWCGTPGAATDTIVIGKWSLNLGSYPKDKVVELLRQHIPADNFFSEHDNDSIERAFKV